VRKEDFVQPWLRRMVKKGACGAYFIFKSMEQGPSFRVTVPKFPTKDPNYRISHCATGTYPIKTLHERPFGRTMLVVTAVSSMNTSLAGSRNPCSRIQRRRARAASARCCSAARRLFFNGDAMTTEEAPKRGTASADPFLVHRRNALIQRQIRLLRERVRIHSACRSNGETLPPRERAALRFAVCPSTRPTSIPSKCRSAS
jgi:hypothetical protein